MKHYVYKLTDPITGQYYFGSRSCEIEPENDDYMGSMKTWTPDDEGRLIKEIIRDDFKTREDAIEFESKIIEENIDDELNENYNIPNKGFHTTGIPRTKEWRNKIRIGNLGKTHSIKTKKLFSKLRSGELHPQYGKTRSEETKNKISNTLKVTYKKDGHPSLGRNHSIETKKKISDNHHDVSGTNNPRARRVRHIETGIVFDTLKQAANYFGYSSPDTIGHHCQGKRKIQKFEYYT